MDDAKIVLQRVDGASEKQRSMATAIDRAIAEMELSEEIKLVPVPLSSSMPREPEDEGTDVICEDNPASDSGKEKSTGDGANLDDDDEPQINPSLYEVIDLRKRVDEMESYIANLHGEVRQLRLKLRTLDPEGAGFQKILEANIVKILDRQNWKISRSNDQIKARVPILTPIAKIVKQERSGPRAPQFKRGDPPPPPRRVRVKKRGFSAPLTSDEDTGMEDSQDAGDEPLAGKEIDDDEYSDPSYHPGGNDSSNLENVKPKITSRKPAPLSKKSAGNVSSPKVMIVKKYDAYCEAPKTPASVIRSGDVSVILEEDYDEQQESDTKQKRTIRAYRPRGGTRKPYVRPKVKCSMCPRECRDQHDLIKHERIHTGEKPYSCSVCGPDTRFTQKYHMQRHMRKYHTLDGS